MSIKTRIINYFDKDPWFKMSIISLIFICIPIFSYLINFANHPLSSDPANWGVFGDYIGGTINTMVSIISLIILGILTHRVGKQSNEENLKTNLLMRRIEVYDYISKYSTSIHKLRTEMILILPNITDKNKLEDNLKWIEKYHEKVVVLVELNSLLETFSFRFGKIFNYDFKQSKFDELCALSEKIKDAVTNYFNPDYEKPKTLINDYNALLDNFIKFLDDLSEELKY